MGGDAVDGEGLEGWESCFCAMLLNTMFKMKSVRVEPKSQL
jgi:hypothetical protein